MTLTAHIVRTMVLTLVVGVIVLLGWNEPLKYRFMSRAQIYAYENPPRDTVDTRAWMFDKSGKKLIERGAYNESRGRGSYYQPPTNVSSRY